MPNWCNNNIEIKGPAAKMEALWDAAFMAERGLLHAMVPMPTEFEGTDNWFGWCVDNWGTKWDVSTEGIQFINNEDGTASITGHFESAWSPPIAAYHTYLEANEDCTITASYYECGMDFGGFYDNGDDEFLEDLHDEYELLEDERSDLFKRLDEEFSIDLALSDDFDDGWDDDELVDNDVADLQH